MIRRCAGRLALLVTVLVAAAATGPAAPPAHADGPTVAVPAAIDSTGGRDVTAALNTFFATIPAGATVRFAAGGRYRVDGTVEVRGARDVVIDGNGATLDAPTDGRGTGVDGRPIGDRRLRARSQLVVRDGVGVTVRNLKIEGPNDAGTYRPALEAQAGLLVRRSRDVTVTGVEIRSTFGDGVYVAGQSSRITIRECELDHNGRQGVAIVAAEHVTVERCTIAHTGRSAIDLEPGRGLVSDVRIVDNRVVDVTNAFVAAIGALAGVQHVTVERNRVSGGRGLTIVAGVPVAVRSDFRVVDNVAEGTSHGLDGVLMSFTRYDGVEVRGNRQSVASGVVPVAFTNSCRTTVTGNEFGADASAPTSTGDCRAPGVAPSRPTATTRPAAARRGTRGGAAAGARRAARRPRPTAPPATVVVTRSDDPDRAVAIVLAFAAGVAAGVGGLVLFLRTRRNSATPTIPGREDDGSGPNEGEGR